MKRTAMLVLPLVVAFIALGATPVQAEVSEASNLLFNSSFELGSAGVVCMKFLRHDSNPEMKYEGPVMNRQDFVSGSQSLRIPNRFAEATEISFGEFSLKPSTKYSLSLWLKSSVEDYPFYVSVVAKKSGHVQACETFKLGKSWKRYSLRFQSDVVLKADAWHVRMLFGIRDRPVDVLLDDIQLVDGAPRPDRAATDLEAVVISPPILFLNDGVGAKPQLQIHIVNHSRDRVSGRVLLKATSEEGSFLTAPESVAFALLPHQFQSIPCTLSFQAYGRYTIMPEVTSAVTSRVLGSAIAVVGTYKEAPIDLDKDFCVGVNCGLESSGGSMPGWSKLFKPAEVAPGIKARANPELLYQTLSSMGCRLLRVWDNSFSWKQLEPEEGVFDFSCLAPIQKLHSDYGFEVVPVLGGMDFVERDGKDDCKLPAWLRAQSELKDFRAMHRKAYMPPVENWRRYVREVAKQLKGAISHYEVMNEPNIIFPVASQADYMLYLKAASEELKKVSPSNQVVAPSTTSDSGGKMIVFLETVLKGGARDCSDVISFHPYGSPTLASSLSADANIDAIRKVLGAFGADRLPLWNTELYYLHDSPNGTSPAERSRFEPKDAACRFLVDLGEGLSQSIAIHASQLFPETDAPEEAPLASYVVYNALARIFEGAKPIGKLRWGENVICYLYERNDRALAAFWQIRGDGVARVSLSTEVKGVKLLDLMGNALPFDTKSILVSPNPCYLLFESAKANEVKQLLSDASIEQL